jgi:hypothetical protein
MPRPTHSGLKVVAVGIGLLLGVLTLYVASIGPATMPYSSEDELPEVWWTVYHPIVWMANNCESFEDVMVWYVNLWGVPTE